MQPPTKAGIGIREVLLQIVSPELRGLGGISLSNPYFMEFCNMLKNNQLRGWNLRNF